MDDVLTAGRALDATGAPIFLDFMRPAYGERISPDAVFQLASIIDIADEVPARIALREQNTNTLIAALPLRYRRSFTLSEIVEEALPYLGDHAFEFFDPESFALKEGAYKIAISVQCDDTVIRSREHRFSVGDRAPRQNKRAYCVYPYKDLLLYEFGSAPCCNLVRNEKLLYNTYAAGGYDPWNNDAWQALRQSFVDGDPIYCHPRCPYLTSEPVSEEEFTRSAHGVDKTSTAITRSEKARYQAYLNGNPVVDSGPSRLAITVGTICNIDCVFCPIPFLDDRRTILTENMLQLLEKHIKSCDILSFTGGEPLVYIKELRKLEKYFHRDLTIQIITNGIAADQLIDFGTQARLALRVSLNCANRDDYIYLHEKDFFARVVRNISELKQARPDVYISLKFMIMKRTVQDIVNFAKLCCDLGVDDCAYTPLWIKTQSSIDPGEKIQGSDTDWRLANTLLEEARDLVESCSISFCWAGWDVRPDDYLEKVQ